MNHPRVISLIIATIPFLFFSQKIIKGTNYSQFQLSSKKDTIDFIVADTNLNIKKPVLLFCQGSQPVPLFVQFEGYNPSPVTLNNFNISQINEYYHVVVISMPHTPVIVGPQNLNYQYNYVRDTTDQYSYSNEFLEDDYLDNYVNRANKVIGFLIKQKWVNSKELIVAGHSQGSKVAVKLASSNKYITKLGLFGYNPFGRVDQFIRDARKKAESGVITWENADSICTERYEFYKYCQDEEAIKSHPYLISWQSFSKGTIDLLVDLEIPVCIAYGSNDIIADMCDLIPLRFIEKGKTNFIVKRYPNLEHNFFPVKNDGSVDHTKGEWQNVMNSFLQWAN